MVILYASSDIQSRVCWWIIFRILSVYQSHIKSLFENVVKRISSLWIETILLIKSIWANFALFSHVWNLIESEKIKMIWYSFGGMMLEYYLISQKFISFSIWICVFEQNYIGITDLLITYHCRHCVSRFTYKQNISKLFDISNN